MDSLDYSQMNKCIHMQHTQTFSYRNRLVHTRYFAKKINQTSFIGQIGHTNSLSEHFK